MRTMHNNLFFPSRLLTFAVFVFFIFSIRTPAQFIQSFTSSDATNGNPPKAVAFANPITNTPGAGCSANNLRAERFSADVGANEREKICRAIDKIADKLNANIWSPALSAELQSIWRVFSTEPVSLRSMPAGTPSQMLAMAEPFPDRTNANIFTAAVYVRPEKTDDAAFFQIMLHELRHVYDFQQTWRDQTTLDSMEIERRAYLLVSKLAQETPEKENFSGISKLWKESWRNRSEAEISLKREKAIQKYLRGKKFYRDIANDPNRQKLDFSYLKTASKSAARQFIGEYDKSEGERLPNRQVLPQPDSLMPQNIHETDLNLEKPKNPRDDKEILRVALSNEKKLYYGMSNFVYDQKLAFQCLKEGKISASFAENHTVARSDNGDALFKLTAAPAVMPCVLNYRDLETDFTNTFWASPALEKMPIYFSGFREIDGITLAQYTVLQPDERLFTELANQYPQIRPFRVPVGTIYVSPEDGQIVRFSGTSFPEETVTGDYARKVRCTYLVQAVRQKLNIEKGLWVTVHVGTVAVANISGKIHPFNYTVNFENYRQSETDVKILDDEEVVAVSR